MASIPNIDLNLPKLLALLNCPKKFAPKFCHRPPPFASSIALIVNYLNGNARTKRNGNTEVDPPVFLFHLKLAILNSMSKRTSTNGQNEPALWFLNKVKVILLDITKATSKLGREADESYVTSC